MVNRSNKLFIEESNRIIYHRFRGEFKHLKLTNSDIFSLALTLGFQQGIREPIVHKFAIIRHETIPTDLFSIMILLAIKELGDNNDWVHNPLIIFDLAEEYANAGIKILDDMMSGGTYSFKDYFTKSILDLNETYDFQSIYDGFYGE